MERDRIEMRGDNISNILLIESDGARQALILMALMDVFPDAVVEPMGTGVEALQAVESARSGPIGSGFDCVLVGGVLSDMSGIDWSGRMAALGVGYPIIIVGDSCGQRPMGGETSSPVCGVLTLREAMNRSILKEHMDRALREPGGAAHPCQALRRRAVPARAQAEIDPLTGLPERSALRTYLANADPDRPAGSIDSFVTIGIDGLGAIRRRHGYAVGDQVIQAVAACLSASVWGDGFACRRRGDEFLVIMRDCELATAMSWAERFSKAMRTRPVDLRSGALPGSVSIGVVSVDGAAPAIRSIRASRCAAKCARRRSSARIATMSMVDFERSVRGGRAGDEALFEQALSRFLTGWRGRMGPTKTNHLTRHAEFVSSMAVRLGEALGVASENIKRLREAGLCHDLGKFLVPERILSKKGLLTKDEKGLLSRHASDGADMARMLGADDGTVACIRHHHVRFDAMPVGGAADEIPMGAHILCVADAFVTMTSHRPYTSTRTFAGALAELERESGRQFAPAVVEAMPSALMVASCDASLPIHA